MSIQRLRLSSAPISYLAQGDADAPLVVCLHGFPDIPRTWTHQMQGLADAGFRVVAPWLRGYAPSTINGPFDMPTLVDDLRALVDELAPKKQFRLVGHDWGAIVANLAIQMQTQSMPERIEQACTMAVPHFASILNNPSLSPLQLKNSWYIGFFQFPILPEVLIKRNDFAFIERIWRMWSPGFTLDEDYRRELNACFDASMPGPLNFYRAFRSRANVKALRACLPPVSTPTLYIHGADDGCVRSEFATRQAQYFSGPFEERILEGAGHFAHLEQPEVVTKSLVDFFTP